PDTRTQPPETGAERLLLDGFLDFHRETLRWKCAGLTDEQLATRSVPTSALALLGLLRHITEVERWWFLPFAGEVEPAPIYFSEAKINDDFDALDTVPPADVLARWDAEVDRVRAVAASTDLDAEFTRRDKQFSLRWVYLHMIEEYARHNGHADLLREAIDGVTGE
ncbi:MAG TPA: DinB family protein, partial [Mycobacteriales bacterium]